MESESPKILLEMEKISERGKGFEETSKNLLWLRFGYRTDRLASGRFLSFWLAKSYGF